MSYGAGFLRAWKLYPHHPSRRNKVLAFKVWDKLHLEFLADRVCEWIEAMKETDDWQKLDGRGSFVPAMEAWLGRPDFSEDPPIHVELRPAGRFQPTGCPRCRGKLQDGSCDWCGWPKPAQCRDKTRPIGIDQGRPK